jgi:uncharacterized protein (TIGR02145 family)
MKKLIKLIGLGLLILSSILPSCKKDQIPTLSTFTITNITATSASSGGIITSDGGATIIEKGVCWGVNANPTTADSKTNDGNGINQFVSNLSGLSAGSTYHVRAYATNSVGTAYGADLSFATLGQVPGCITQPATNMTSSGATLNGTVNANYLSTTVTFEYGITISYGQTVTSAQSPVIGNNATSVSANLSGLNPGTTYHFRIKALNELGTTYGEDLTFTTLTVVPTITTTAVIDRTYSSAISGGNISSDGGSLVTSRGICWSTIPNPTINGEHTTDGTGTGSFTSNVRCLSFATTYYVRAYATNSIGTAYGDEISFTTLGINPIIFNPDLTYGSVSDIDGNCYKTIQIGDQTWMAENLKVTHYRDGTNSEVVWYNNDPSTYKDTYGALYTWYTVSSDKICPTEWHVPSKSEWITLTTFLGGESVAGGKLKETGTIHWTSPNTGANNETGFTALPGGISTEGGFRDAGNYGYWWSRTPLSTGIVPYFASNQTLAYDQSTFHSSGELNARWISIRCIKDVGPNLTTDPATDITHFHDPGTGYEAVYTLTSGGHVINNNGSAITHKGICWNYIGNPVINDYYTDEGSGSENFKSTITFNEDVLLHGIHIRAYATNGDGTGYGNEIVLYKGDLE